MTALKILIAAMTVLIILGVGLVSWRVFTMATEPGGALGQISLALPENCTIASATISGDSLVIRAAGGGDCESVRVIDLKRGAITATITR